MSDARLRLAYWSVTAEVRVLLPLLKMAVGIGVISPERGARILDRLAAHHAKRPRP